MIGGRYKAVSLNINLKLKKLEMLQKILTIILYCGIILKQ